MPSNDDGVQSATVIDRLINDLRRPGGGWTTGFVTIFGALLVIVLDLVGQWPAASWTAQLSMISLIVAHILWGSLGYYPRRIA